MAVSLTTVEAAITAVQDEGQSVTVDGQSYTLGNLSALIELRDRLQRESERSDGTRPVFRRFKFGGMGY